MEISDVINGIADALTAVLGKDVYGVASSHKDERFPVYVRYVVMVGTIDGEWSTRMELRVHGGEVSKECAYRRLTTQLLVSILRLAEQGELAVHKKELKV